MPKVPIYEPIKRAEITLYYEDRITKGSHTFSTVQELADFLKDNPELAKAVNYSAKKK